MTEKTELSKDAQAVIDANVSDSPAMLGKLSHADLLAVEEAEKAGEKRSTLLEAVTAEHADRAKDADDTLELARDAAARAGRDPVGDPTLIMTECARLQQQVDTLKTQLAEAKKNAGGRTPAKAKKAKPRTLELGAAGMDGATTIAFTGEDGRTLPDLPEMEFGAGAFRKTRRGDGVELTEAITFPQGVRKTPISKIWLVDDKGNAAGLAQLVNPLVAGGGTTATIPAGSLVFRNDSAKG